MAPRSPTLIRAFRELDSRDVRFVARTGVFAFTLPALLRTLPLPTLVSLMAGDAGDHKDLPETLRQVRLTDAVLRRGRGPFRANCAVRSLILLRYLRRIGEPAVIWFGVRRTDGELDGHAWITIDGIPLSENDDPRELYKPTFHFPEDHS